MINIREYIKCEQDNIEMFLFSLNSDELINNSYVDYYIQNEDEGYQRPLYGPHYRKIANYILDSKNGLLPTSIIAAIDKKNFDLNNDGITIKDKFRVVDGQHRREALSYLKRTEKDKYENRISKLNFPIVLMLIDKKVVDEYLCEIQAFIDINKKGKKVSTDLAYSLLKRITESRIEKAMDVNKSEIYELIAINIAKKINGNPYCCWYDSIKSGGNDDYGKPVSQNAFIKSIVPFVELYYSHVFPDGSIKENVEKCTSEIEKIIVNVWKKVGDKWSECFYWEYILEAYRYDKDFNIQKGIGVYPLHDLLYEKYKEEPNDFLNSFDKCLQDSVVISTMWGVGEEFSASNSKSGFNFIKKVITGEEEIVIKNQLSE